ncbi:hypothetical protein QJS10_CPA07g00827 [Acorus calamus]|uniref:Uncharacterized protein n=1 Tax=Acorus calamus TaxID=4465 RepID=A0AAV9EET5_ACOCL|nr:hypothetical protein QJS10_CPA07g00827 [Acorus calamus]
MALILRFSISTPIEPQRSCVSRKPPLQAISSRSTSNLTRDESDFFWVDYLEWKLHESAKSFHTALQDHELGRNNSHLSKAWIAVGLPQLVTGETVGPTTRGRLQRQEIQLKKASQPKKAKVPSATKTYKQLAKEKHQLTEEEQVALAIAQSKIEAEKLQSVYTKVDEVLIQDFLSHFGGKVLRSGSGHDAPFWMGLVQRKLVVGLQRENVPAKLNGPCNVKVVTEEIGWLNFYATFPGTEHQDRKRLKQHIIQAEKEIIHSTALKICSDMFSSFTHYAKSSEPSLHENSISFIKERKSSKITKAFTPMLELGKDEMEYTSTLFRELEQDVEDAVTKGSIECVPQEAPHIKADIWTGTRLLCIDLSVAADLIWKKTCGSALTVREAKKISRAVADITCVIPLTILMLLQDNIFKQCYDSESYVFDILYVLMMLQITAIGHAALFAAIKRYIPCLDGGCEAAGERDKEMAEFRPWN